MIGIRRPVPTRGGVIASLSALCLCLFMAAGQARADVMQHIPADAFLVVRVNNMQSVNTKIGALAQQFGIAAFSPKIADPLGPIVNGMHNGLVKDREMAVYMPSFPDGEEPPVVAVVPVSDYQAFLSNFTDVQTEGDVNSFIMAGSANRTYAMKRGDYVAFSSQKEFVAAKAEGIETRGVTAQSLSQKDVVILSNMRVLRERLLPRLEEGRATIIEELTQELDKNLAPAGGAATAPEQPEAAGAADATQPDVAAAQPKLPASLKPVALAAVNRAIDVVKQLIQDTDASTLGITFSNDGIGLTAMTEFTEGSYLGNAAMSIKGTDKPLLDRLPAQKYLFFGGAAFDPQPVTKLVNDLVAPIEKELAGAGAEGKALQDYVDAVRAAAAAATESRFGMVAPTGMLGQSSLLQTIAVSVGDAAKLATAQRKMLEAQENVTGLFMSQGPQMKTSFTESAKTVDGVELDQFKTTLELEGAAAASPEAQQMAMMMSMMYGPEGLGGVTGVVDEKHLIAVMGGDDVLIESAIKAIKSGENPTGQLPHVQSVSGKLPQNRIGEMYVSVGDILSTVVNYAQQFGMGVPIQIPANLPPLGFSLSTEATAAKVDLFIPAPLVQSLVAAGMQAMMQMQHGMQPGGPGGL